MKSQDIDDEVGSTHEAKLWAWLITQVVVPLAVLTASGVCAAGLFDVDFAFQKTLAGADVILISALLFAGIVIDIYCGTRLGLHLDNRRSLDRHFFLTLLAAIMFFFFYAVIKVVTFQYDFPGKASGVPIDHHLNVCTWASLGGGIFALSWSVWTNFYIQDKLLKIERDEILNTSGGESK